MTFSIYKNKQTLEREAREAKQAQREQEKETADQRRQQQKASSFKNVWTQTDNDVREAQAKQEARKMAPILKEQAESERLMRDLRKATAQNLLTQPDEERFVEAASVANESEKVKFIQEQYALFVEDNPEWIDSKENRDALGKYFQVNGIILPTVATIAHAAEKLEDAGLIQRKAAPKPQPEPQPWTNVEDYDFSTGKPSDIVAGWNWTNPTERCSLTHKQLNELLNKDERAYKIFCRDAMKSKPAEKQPDGEYGYERGEKVWKSNWEVSQMGSDEYRRFAKLRTNIDQLLVQPELVSDL